MWHFNSTNDAVKLIQISILVPRNFLNVTSYKFHEDRKNSKPPVITVIWGQKGSCQSDGWRGSHVTCKQHLKLVSKTSDHPHKNPARKLLLSFQQKWRRFLQVVGPGGCYLQQPERKELNFYDCPPRRSQHTHSALRKTRQEFRKWFFIIRTAESEKHFFRKKCI